MNNTQTVYNNIKSAHEINIIPLLSSLEKKPICKKKGKYIALSKFDYEYYSKNGLEVEYSGAEFDDYIKFENELIQSIPDNTVNIKIKNSLYRVDIKRIYISVFLGSLKKHLFRYYHEKKGLKLNKNTFDNIADIDRVMAKGRFSVVSRIQKGIKHFNELVNNKNVLVEQHNIFKNNRNFNNLFKNHIYNIFKKQLIHSLSLKIVNRITDVFEVPDYVRNDLKTTVRDFIATLFFLEFKKNKEIHISNFTGNQQYAAILYGEAKRIPVRVVQHGRYFTHHLPGPEKLEYLPDGIELWEDEFTQVLGKNKDFKKIDLIPRIDFSNIGKSKDYILLVPSATLFTDIDIYYEFWKKISELKNIYTFKMKLHSHDKFTEHFLSYFGISDRVKIIPKIEFLPNCAITVNTTMVYELNGYVPVLNYINSLKTEEIERFLEKISRMNKYS